MPNVRGRGLGHSVLAAAAVLASVAGFEVAGGDTPAAAAAEPSVTVEPPLGTAAGAVTVTGTGFTSGQSVQVVNEQTAKQVCSATVATDGTIACTGNTGARSGTTSTIGVGTATARYRAVRVGEIATVAGGG